MDYEHIIQPFEPVFNADSKVLILGSLPSAASREYGFYYGHPKNRLWSVLAKVLNEPLPASVEDRRDMLLKHGIAMWDVIWECDIKGSSDASIKNAVPADIGRIVSNSRVHKVFLNGKTAGRLYEKYAKSGLEYRILPSTSPANAAFSLDRLIGEWQCITSEEVLK